MVTAGSLPHLPRTRYAVSKRGDYAEKYVKALPFTVKHAFLLLFLKYHSATLGIILSVFVSRRLRC